MDVGTAALVEEFVQRFLEHRGELELGRAVSLLSPRNREVVSDFGALKFVKRFPQLFKYDQTVTGRQKRSKVMVTLDVPLEFCPQAGERAGCTNRKCDGLHLCPFFVKESCKFGAKCKRSHNYLDEHTISVLKHFRLGFLNPSLLQKILKIILDESEIQRAASSRSVPDICKFYNKAPVCKKGENCPCLHVCEHFVDGDCKFGEKCKRKHDFSDSHNVRVLEEYDMDDISDRKVLQRLQGRERKRTVSASSDGEKPEQFKPMSAISNAFPSYQANDDKEKDTEICGFNLRGKCNYGNSCIHRHTELPYIWEFAAEGDGKWESFSSDLNMMLEHAYCDVNNDSSATLMIKGFLYHIRFQDMTAVAVLPVAGMYI